MSKDKVYKGATCKGSYRLGTACGNCERCEEELYSMDSINDLQENIDKNLTCGSCRFATPFERTVVCGYHIITFSKSSLCEQYRPKLNSKNLDKLIELVKGR